LCPLPTSSMPPPCPPPYNPAQTCFGCGDPRCGHGYISNYCYNRHVRPMGYRGVPCK
ncbi:hypothetical protein BDQ17DRAFT_1357543, partial [Cyathus striatus]